MPTKAVRSAILALAVFVVAVAGCGREAPRGRAVEDGQPERRIRPNVLLIEICSLRQDHVGCMGYDRPTTPTIDSIAARGLTFRRCISPSSWTKPSTASILTGLSPGVHQLVDGAAREEVEKEGYEPKRVLPERITTLAEQLQQAGYATGGFVANVNAWPIFGVNQGFDHYYWEEPHEGPVLVDRFTQWAGGIEEHKPFFGFLLFYDAHLWYAPPYQYYQQFTRDADPVEKLEYSEYCRELNRIFHPEQRAGKQGKGPKDPSEVTPERLRQWIDLYDGGVRYVDDCIKQLLEYLDEKGASGNTTVVVISDHGDMHMEYGTTGHGHSMYQELIHVPLVMSLPDQSTSGVVDDLVSGLDVFPTICDLAGVEVTHALQGESLVPYTQASRAGPGGRLGFSTNEVGAGCVQDRDWKFRRWLDGSEGLYDLSQEASEETDVSLLHPLVTAEMSEALDALLEGEEALRQTVGRASTRELSPEAVRELKSLGYL